MKSMIISRFAMPLACSLLVSSRVLAEQNDTGSDTNYYGEIYDDEEEFDLDMICADDHENCQQWASTGECEKNPNYMGKNCRRSCNACFEDPDFLYDQERSKLQRGGDFGVPQRLYFKDGSREEDIQWILGKARNYMNYIVPEKFEEGMEDLCLNNNDHCAWWALMGESYSCHNDFMLG